LTYQKYSSLLAGNDAYIPVPPSSYDLLETEILASDTASVTFSSLNSTYGADYQHLQLRIAAKAASGNSWVDLRFNGSSPTSDLYSWRELRATSGGINAYQDSTGNYDEALLFTMDTNGVGVCMDILDPFVSTKKTTMRTYSGDGNSYSRLASANYQDTAVIDSFRLAFQGGAFATNSRFSLYGLRKAA
jgi:hypothetical protein